MNFGMWLEQLLKENRLTKTWLAKKAKVSHSMINYWKTRSDPSLLRAYQVVQLIAEETNLSKETILECRIVFGSVQLERNIFQMF